MTSPGNPPIGATDRPPDRPDGPASSPGTGTLTVNDEPVMVRQRPTNQNIVAGGVLPPPSPLVQGLRQPEVDVGSKPSQSRRSVDQQSEASDFDAVDAPSLRGRVQVQHQATEGRTWRNRVTLGLMTFGGIVAGAGFGAAASSWTGPGAIIGALVGAVIGWKMADWASDGPQKRHLDQAIERLAARPGGLSVEQKARIGRVSDEDWRTLLRVPCWKGSSSGVERSTNRQRIREQLVAEIAAGGSVDDAVILKKLLIARHNWLSATPGTELKLLRKLGESRLPAQERDALREGLGLRRDDLPDDIDDKISRLVATARANDREENVRALMLQEAGNKAAASNDRNVHDRVVRRIVANAVREGTAANNFLGGRYTGRPQLLQILQKSDRAFSRRLESAAETVAGKKDLGSLSSRAVVGRHGQTKSAAQLQRQAEEAISNLNHTMMQIVGGKEDYAIGHQVDFVAKPLRDLLKTIADAAKTHARAGVDPDALARTAVSDALALLYLDRLLPKEAEAREEAKAAAKVATDAAAGANPAARANLAARARAKARPAANLAYNRKLVQSVLVGRAAFDQDFPRRDDQAWQAAQGSVKAAVQEWHEPVRKFVDALIGGQAPEA